MNWKHWTICLALALSAAACDNTDNPAPDNWEAEAADVAQAENLSEDMLLLVDQAVLAGPDDAIGPEARHAKVEGATVTFFRAQSANPDTVVIDFGSSNVAGPFGRQRRGQLTAVYTTPYGAVGSSVSVTTQDYFVNDNGVQGTRTVARTQDANGSPVYEVQQSLVIAVSGGGTIRTSGTRTRTFLAGSSTPGLEDDLLSYSGALTIEGSRGFTYNSVAQDLRRDRSCTQYTAGTLTARRQRANDENGVQISYGDGSCDDIATATVLQSGRTFTLNLR